MVPGHLVNNDILIIIGASKAHEAPAKHILEVTDAIMKLLRGELGLEVLPAKTRFALNDTAKLENHVISSLNLEALPGSNKMQTVTRRPAVLQRLKVSKKSIHNWLRRKVKFIGFDQFSLS